MPALTVKNIPETLYNRLKETALSHNRSIDDELIHCLERILPPIKKNPAEHLKRAREIRKGIDTDLLNVDDIRNAIEEGRA